MTGGGDGLGCTGDDTTCDKRDAVERREARRADIDGARDTGREDGAPDARLDTLGDGGAGREELSEVCFMRRGVTGASGSCSLSFSSVLILG